MLTTRPDWAKNGTFVTYRHLKQLVPEFHKFIKDIVTSSITLPAITGNDKAEFDKRVAYVGARLIGRYKSGMTSLDSLLPYLLTISFA